MVEVEAVSSTGSNLLVVIEPKIEKELDQYTNFFESLTSMFIPSLILFFEECDVFRFGLEQTLSFHPERMHDFLLTAAFRKRL